MSWEWGVPSPSGTGWNSIGHFGESEAAMTTLVEVFNAKTPPAVF